MIRCLHAALLLLCLCAFAPPKPRPKQPSVPASVSVTHRADQWVAQYRFHGRAPVWVFKRSALARKNQQPWRLQSWKVLTPGVHLERLGNFDALVADKGNVPSIVRIRFAPFAEGLLADYDPALAFTDGSVALYTEHFDLAPVGSAKLAASLPSNLSGVPEKDQLPIAMTFSDARGPVLVHGSPRKQASLWNDESYVLFGKARVVQAPAIATVMDPKLPAWLTAELGSFTPKLLSFYTGKLGPHAGPKPTVMATWAGPTPGMRSMGGSVLPGTVTMRFEGSVVTQESKAVRDTARWFIAHEGSHFWLGQTVRYGSPNEAWITEGGADLMAMRAVAAVDPAYDAKAELQHSLDDCVKLAGKPIATAAERNEHRAYYACGAIFGRVAEQAMKARGADFYAFWRRLIANNQSDKVVDRDDWLGELTKASGKPQLAQSIAAMLDQSSPDPKGALASLLTAGGVPYSRAADGRLVLQ